MTAELDAQFEAILTSGQAALDKTRGVFPSESRLAESEWGYGVAIFGEMDDVQKWTYENHARAALLDGEDFLVRRRKAGPWEPLEN